MILFCFPLLIPVLFLSFNHQYTLTSERTPSYSAQKATDSNCEIEREALPVTMQGQSHNSESHREALPAALPGSPRCHVQSQLPFASRPGGAGHSLDRHLRLLPGLQLGCHLGINCRKIVASASLSLPLCSASLPPPHLRLFTAGMPRGRQLS